MCGIAGFLGGGSRETIEAMTRALVHRGPDAEGYWQDPGHRVHFGHRRLSILDLEGGAQPMVAQDGRFCLVFNGEIYNHMDLRRELEAGGAVFQTDHSDTETLLAGFREWGRELPSRLNGMWAFAVWDRETKSLFASRDRFGKKPFYYFWRNNTFAFASELTSLMLHPEAPRDLSEIARVKFLAHALLPAPHTPFAGVWKLPAGHNLVFSPGEELRTERYWRFQIEPDEPAGGEAAAAEQLAELIERATARRLVADVPVGVFLSGGLDSSAVAAFAAKTRPGKRLHTFTIGFTEPSFDESAYAEEVAFWLGSDHRCEHLAIDRARQILPGLLDQLDEPQGDASLLPTSLLCRFAREQVTVALGGDGGDELFAGYDPFRAIRAAQWYARLVPRPVHGALRALAARLPVSHANISLDFKIKRTLRGLSYPARLWNPVWLGCLEPDAIQALTGSRLDPEEIFSEAIAAWDSCASRNPVDKTLQFYTEIYLQDGILAKADRASMLHSLEVRSPFLDIEIADFARRLPARHKIQGQRTKAILKRALRGVLPDRVIDRKKKGFGVPVGKWFRDGSIPFEPRDATGQRLLAAHRSGTADERLYLWCDMVWQEWSDRRASCAA